MGDNPMGDTPMGDNPELDPGRSARSELATYTVAESEFTAGDGASSGLSPAHICA
jgi:hypothetical protein